MRYLSPKDVIKKSFLKRKLHEDQFKNFKQALKKFLNEVKDNDEEYNKTLLKDFLQKYLGYEKYKINTKDKIDLSIYQDDTVEVIFEIKAPKNRAEMISFDNFNKKALHECLLYYLREKIKNSNYNIKHIIITDTIEWFIFNAVEFNKLSTIKEIEKIYKQKEVEKTFFSLNNNEFYRAMEKILKNNEILKNIKCVRINFKDKKNDTQLKHIFKLLSPIHLLKNYYDNDANSLNKNFYYELLYILGLEEIKNGSKKLISRKSKNYREDGSFIENTILKLQTEHDIEDEEKLFEIALELNITWLNRILFLKLLEARLIQIHNGDYPKFLHFNITDEFDKLNTLFFEVLAKKSDDRKSVKIEQYKKVPYLNSSLFEPTKLERNYLRISNLKDNVTLKKYQRTVLKDEPKKLGTLEYLLKFLNTYDFGSNEKDEFKNDHTPLINSAVLGLIFEKLNGYKDGSFFTPSFITMYMTKEAIRKSVVDKFNKNFNWNCKTIDDVYNKDYDLQEANKIINSITICDLAVGSGHFLVSALNELLSIKSELAVLCDSNGKRLKNIKLSVEDDEIYILDEDGEVFEYTVNNNYKIFTEKIRIQKTIFNEKLRIIENQLFGVDINPNSVKITRLRLWIELLKDSYYDEKGKLVTLPNIDINIKCGNSLISKFPLNDKETKNRLLKDRLNEYKDYVKQYKVTNDKAIKKEVIKKIKEIKQSFTQKLKGGSPLVEELKRLLNGNGKNKKGYIEQFGFKGLNEDVIMSYTTQEYYKLYARFGENYDPNLKSLFSESIKLTQKEKKELKIRQKKELKKIISKYKAIKDYEDSKIYENSFEWRFEFPEVLDDDGEFVGFDIVIGNPPYIMEDENKDAFEGLHTGECYQGKTDIWHLFTCKAILLIKENGLISFIAKNQWLNSASASKMRKKIYEKCYIGKIIDFGANMIFDGVGQQTMIFLLTKTKTNKEHHINFIKFNKKIPNSDIAKVLLYGKESESITKSTKVIPKFFDEKENLTFSSSKNENILTKIDQKKNFEFDSKKEIIQGIIGGPDKAFIIDKNELDKFNEDEKEFIKILHTNTQRFYTPSSNQYIFYISKKNFDGRNIEDYPNIYRQLLNFKEQLQNRREVLKGSIKWFYLWWARDEKFFKDGSKIIFSSRTKGRNFTFTNESFYGTRNLFFIKSDRVSLRYITALLNSKLFYFYMSERLKHTGNLLQIDKNQFMKIPLYIPTEVKKFEKLVDSICDLKKQNRETTKLKNKIDKMVYELYGLSDEDVRTIENYSQKVHLICSCLKK